MTIKAEPFLLFNASRESGSKSQNSHFFSILRKKTPSIWWGMVDASIHDIIFEEPIFQVFSPFCTHYLDYFYSTLLVSRKKKSRVDLKLIKRRGNGSEMERRKLGRK